MKIEINIKKEHFYFLTVLIAVLFVFGVSAYNTNNPPQFGHSGGEIFNISSSKVLPGIFNGSINSLFTFPGDLAVNRNLAVLSNMTVSKKITAGNITVNDNITLGGVSRDTWPAGNSQLPATNITAGTFGANVGNGNYAFPANLTVLGKTNTSGGLIIEVRSSDPLASELYAGRMWLIKP